MRTHSPSEGARRRATRGPRAAQPSKAALRVLFLINEADPLIKVGGLADVGGSLPAALRELGLDVRMALPLHPAMRSLVHGERPAGAVGIPSTAGVQTASVYVHRLGRMPVWLVDGPPLREAEAIYHSRPEEDAAKHIFTSIAALAYAIQSRWIPDVVHANDWHTAPALYWMRMAELARDRLARTAGLLTIHNLPYLGNNAGAALRMFGLPLPGEPDGPAAGPKTVHGHIPEWARDALLALGIASAERLVAVSPTYGREILTPEFGSGLDALLRARKDSLDGILNGIDLRAWDPTRDARLAVRFDANRLPRRAENSTRLRETLSLASDPARPIVGIVSRLDRQKGLDFALPALEGWLAAGGQVAVLGSGDPELETAYSEFGERHPGQVGVRIGYDADLAARIYGGAHLHLMPSRYEPCGLSQMIAMRYGSLPLVRSTGGLKDTVRDSRLTGGTGFTFDEATSEALGAALQRAMEVFAQPFRWRVMQRRGMRKDYGWGRSARQYAVAYRRAVRTRARAAKPRGEGR